jgi:hypothetical protein
MSLTRNYLSKFKIKIDHIEIKKNFVNITTKKTIIIKNPYYEYLKKNPVLKTSLKKINFNEKKLYKRNGKGYNMMLRKLKTSFRHEIDRILFYENYNYKEKKFFDDLTLNKRRFFIFKRLLNSFLGLLILFKIRIVKILNFGLLFFIIFYFGYDESIFSFLLDPKIESNLYEIDKFAYIPDKYNFRNLIRQDGIENSPAVLMKVGTSKRLNEFRESFEIKDEIKDNIEKRLLKYERLKILIMGSYYKVKVKNYEDNEIFNSIERKKPNYFLDEYWKESFILRRIHNIYSIGAAIFRKIRKLILGEITLTHWIMKNSNLEKYYIYRHLTLNERIRCQLNYLRSVQVVQRLLNYIDRRYTPMIEKHLKLIILNFFEDKKTREDLFNWLATFLFIKIEFRDFLLEKICMFLLEWIDSPGFDNVIRIFHNKFIRKYI